MRTTRRLALCLGIVCTIVAAMFATVPITTAGAGLLGPPTDGYVVLGGDGGIFTFNVPMAGAAASDPARCPNGTCTSMALTPSGQGYWIMNLETGTIYPYGTAGFYGDPATSDAHTAPELKPRYLQIVPTVSGHGYFVYGTLSGLGMMEGFGDATVNGFFGNTFSSYPWGTGNPPFRGHPVAMAMAPGDKGYWEVWSDGGVYAFGAAGFYGSMGGRPLAREIIGITPTADGKGYWLLGADGGVFAFGDAKFGGSTGGLDLVAPVVGMTRNPSGPGYWLVAADGGVFTFGGAPFFGSIAGYGYDLHQPIVGIASKRTSVG
jgi:hypothetical protein